MSNTVSGELYFFLYATATGIILSAVYDTLRIIRRVYPHGTLAIAIEDFLYWVASALYISYTLLQENDGIIRWFFIFGLLLGMLVYNLTISRFLVSFVSKILKQLLHIIRTVLHFLLKPLSFLKKKLKKINKKLKKTLKSCIKPIRIDINRK